MRPLVPKLPHIFYGGDYNPEQWPEKVWAEDMKLMQEAGVNLATVGVFSWARLEPRPGHYTFDWLDRVLDLLAAHGICADLATATASPPPWLSHQYPESLPRDAQMRMLYPGGRQHYCPNSVAYRRHAAALVRQLAERYQRHPALAMWHINNEYACHLPACYCDTCAVRFREWLRTRYHDLARLNDCWNTAFWSQWYGDWEEILPPRIAPAGSNPCQQLDYLRFTHESFLSLCVMERRILEELTPGVPVTTNFMAAFKPLDYFAWAERLDFVSWDSYPEPSGGCDEVARNALMHDQMRSLKPDRPFVLMEQAPGHVNWRDVNVLKPPGMMRAYSYQAVARGADGVMFFQWRASRAGSEKFHGGMVPHVGAEHSRIFAEVRELGQELKQLDALVGTTVPAEVGIVFDAENRWAVELGGKVACFDYLAHLMDYYRPLFDQNVAVRLIQPAGDWTGCKLVIAPLLYLLTEAAANNIRRFVADGGVLVMTYFSGIVDEYDRVRLGGYPALLRDVLGLWVEEWQPLHHGVTRNLRVAGEPAPVTCSFFCDLAHLEGATALATYADDFYAGRPAITVNTFGRGRAYYLATRLDAAYLARFLAQRCAEAGVQPVLRTPVGVEATLRTGGADRFLVLVNHHAGPCHVELAGHAGTDLLTGRSCAGALDLPAFGVAVVRLAT